MKSHTLFLLLLFVCAGCGSAAQPIQSGLALPPDYRETYLHYATVDRADGVTRDLFINPEAADILQRTGRLPENTRIVIEAYQAERDENNLFHVDAFNRLFQDHPLDMIHVMEKRSTWTDADFPTPNRTGSWNFGSFDFNTGAQFEEDLGACFNCHNATPQTDFIYSRRLLQQYLATGEVQYFRCDLSGRIAC